MVLTGQTIDQLADALLSAFPKNADLEQFVLLELSQNLNWIVNVNAGLRVQAIELIRWANDQSRIKELVDGARRVRPDNPQLGAVPLQFTDEETLTRGDALGLRLVERESVPSYRVMPGSDGYALYCNRAPQWDLVESPRFEKASELVFVPGTFEQGHEYFIKRIKRRLAIHPKSIVEVGWPASYACPQSRGELLEMLALALGDTPVGGDADALSESIARTLAGRLLQRNILLVHATLSMDSRADLVPYYTQWLPDILRRASQAGGCLRCLKCYQPIEWLEARWFSRARAALTRAFMREADDASSESAARALIQAVVRGQSEDVLRVRCLPDLEDITDRDLVDLCAKWDVTTPGDQQRLVEKCATVHTSSAKLKIVDAVFPSLLRNERRAAA